MFAYENMMLLFGYFLLGCLSGKAVAVCRRLLPLQEAEVRAVLQAAGPAVHRSSTHGILTALGTGVLFVLAGLFCVPGAELVFCWLFLCCLLLQSLIDYDWQLLPDKISCIMAGAGFFYAAYFQKNLTAAAAGLAAAGGIMLLLFLLSRGGMGFGDVKLAAVLGLWLGAEKALLCLLLAFVGGGITGILLLLTGRCRRREAIAFGPFLCLGGAAAMLWGDRLLSCYWQMFISN